MKKKYKIIIAVIVGAVIVFYAGTKFSSKSLTAQDFQNLPQDQKTQLLQQLRGAGGNGAMARGQGQNGGNVISGDVVAKDSQSMTVKMRNGNTSIVFYSPSTSVTKPVSGTINDVNVGSQVFVLGTSNPDGSVVAQSIQLRESTSTSMGR